jgi:hypothetical protein
MTNTNSFCRLTKNLILLITFVLSFSNVFAQTYNQELFTYISPKPNSKNNSPSNDIIISVNQEIKNSWVNSGSLINVEGQSSGNINGRVIKKENTILFIPDKDFLNGDKIKVDLSKLALHLGDFSMQSYFTFSVSEKSNLLSKNILDHIYKDELGIIKNSKNVIDTLPSGFPQISLEIFDDPSDGYLFFGVFGNTEKPALLITENSGNPIFYLQTNSDPTDFKKQPTGQLTYFDSGTNKFYALNNNYELVDSFYCGNGFKTDLHELLVLPNYHSYLLGLDPQIIDMSQYVEGGKEDATVIGFVIQELDENKNVIFQWRSLDYISVLDAEGIDFTRQVIDYIHTNSICVDFDGNLIISSRNLNEITKINRQTGKIIWRLGGKKNQFFFINEEYDFYRQHDARRLQNGNILFFDNGNYHTPQFSRAVEYDLDEINFTATKVWQYRNDPDLHTSAMGNARRLDNGNTLISWSRAGFITEVTPDGEKALEIKFPEELYSYRVFKAHWDASIYQSQLDTLDFGEIAVNSSQLKSITIQSNSEKEITITGIFNTLAEYSVLTKPPLIISPYGEVVVDVVFSPKTTGVFLDTLNIRSDSDSSLINSLTFLNGMGSDITKIDDESELLVEFRLMQNYPNPFNPTTKIKYSIPSVAAQHNISLQVKLVVYDILGDEVAILVNETKPSGTYEIEFDATGLASGIYFYKLRAGSFIATKKMLLIK